MEKVCFLVQLHPFEKASKYLKRFFHIEVSKSCIHELSRKLGTQLFDRETEKSQNPSSEAYFPENPDKLPQRVYIEVDAARINTKEGYKDNNLAMIFETVKTATGKLILQNKTFTSSLAMGWEDLKKRLHLLLLESKNWWATEIIVISDGAEWIANIKKLLLPGVVHIIDWFHLSEHLWDCARGIFGESSDECLPWVKKYESWFMEQSPEFALQKLDKEIKVAKDQTSLRSLYNYIAPRIDNMRYKEFRAKNYCIGSGAIESANKYVIQERLKRPGMKWSITGGNAMGHMRALSHSNRWDNLWITAA